MKKTLIGLGAITLLGIVCWIIQLVKGEVVTNMNHFVPWGLYIIGFMIFTGISAGSLLFAGSVWCFEILKSYRPYTLITTFVGVIGGLLGAGLFIVVDLGNPLRGIYMLLTPNIASPLVWDETVLSAYGIIGVYFLRQLYLVQQGKRSEASLCLPAILALIAGIAVIITSFAFVLLVSSPLWNNPGESLSFLLAAVIAALGVLTLVLKHLNTVAYVAVPSALLQRMGYVMSGLLVLELLFAVGEAALALYAPHGEEAAAVFWQLIGKGAPWYWTQIICSLLAVYVLRHDNYKALRLQWGTWLALGAVFLIKYNLLQANQLNPLLPYAGPSILNPPLMTAYVPSIIEIGTSVGIMAGVCLFVALGLLKFKDIFTGKFGKVQG